MKIKTYFNQDKVLVLLEKNHMTQSDLAGMLEIGASYLSLMLGGHRPVSPKLRKRFVDVVEKIENRTIEFEEFFLSHNYHNCEKSQSSPTGTDG